MHPLGPQGQCRPTSAEAQPSEGQPSSSAPRPRLQARTGPGRELAWLPSSHSLGSDCSFLLTGLSSPQKCPSSWVSLTLTQKMALSSIWGQKPGDMPPPHSSWSSCVSPPTPQHPAHWPAQVSPGSGGERPNPRLGGHQLGPAARILIPQQRLHRHLWGERMD